MKRRILPIALAVSQACASDVSKTVHAPHNDGPRETVCDAEDVLNDYHDRLDVMEPVSVRVCVHKVLDAHDQLDAYDEEDLARSEHWYRTTIFDRVDERFTHVDFDVQSVDHVVHDNASMYLDIRDDDEARIAAADELHVDLAKPGCLNVYYVQEDDTYAHQNDGFALGTYGEHTSDIFLVMPNPSSTTHEMGHALGLWHTHETAYGDSVEHPEDGYGTGDLIPDTGPDPGPYALDYETMESTGDCSLEMDYGTGEVLDVECEKYPEFEESLPYDNVMSYYHVDWDLTPYQNARAACYAANYYHEDGLEGGQPYDFVYDAD